MKTEILLTTDVHLTDGFKASGTSPPDAGNTKVCSACEQEKALSEFYKKGSRTDSACKACQKKKKQTKYVASKGKDVVAGLMSIIELTTQGLSNRIRSEIRKIDEVILCLKSKR